MTRGDRTVTAVFPELATALAAATAGRSVVLDGELVVAGAGGRPDFTALQARARSRPGAAVRARWPVRMVCFDLLHLDGADLVDQPLSRRRELLESLALEAVASASRPRSPRCRGGSSARPRRRWPSHSARA